MSVRDREYGVWSAAVERRISRVVSFREEQVEHQVLLQED